MTAVLIRALTFLLCLATVAAPARAAAPASALDRLQGEWRGRDTGNLQSWWTLSVKGSEYRFQGPGSQEWYEGTLQLHPGEPARIDLEIARCDCVYKGTTSLGLFAVEGDRLTFIGAEPGYPRPEKLEDTERCLLMHLRRRE